MKTEAHFVLAKKLADAAAYALENGGSADARDLYMEALEYLIGFQFRAIAEGGSKTFPGMLEEADRLEVEWGKGFEESVRLNNAQIMADQKAIDAL